MLSWLKSLRPTPSLVISLIALAVALSGTAYAAGLINGNRIRPRTITGGKIKRNAITGYQIRLAKLGTVLRARRATGVMWAVVRNPKGPGNSELARASDPGISVNEDGGAVNVIFPRDVTPCANVAGRNSAGTGVPGAGIAQTNVSPANPEALEVRTRDRNGGNRDGPFHLVVVCPG